MGASIINPNKNSRRGRPKADTEQVGIRFPAETLKRIDDWRREQQDMPIRTEAIRRLVEQALGSVAETDALKMKVAQAYQVIGILLAGPGDAAHPDFSSVEGQRALDYFGSETFEEDFLPFYHPRDENGG